MTDNETLTHLKSARARRPELADTLDLHIAILDARGKVEIQNSKFEIHGDEAKARLERGEPLFRAHELTLDWDAFVRLFKTICDIAARHRPADADAFVELVSQTNSSARAEEVARAYFEETQHATRDARRESSATRHAPLLDFVLNNALHPFLAAYARAWKSLVNDEQWYRAYCPICGGAPDFSALEKASGARRLLCARCDFEWTFHRAVCPFCGEDAPGKLGYFPSGDGVYRLYTCANCKRYLKTIDRRELARETNPPAERVLTIAMDVMAREAGYH